jgi:hypothetical protein
VLSSLALLIISWSFSPDGYFGFADWNIEHILENMKQSTFFLSALDSEERTFQTRCDLAFSIQSDKLWILQTSTRELDERLWQGGTVGLRLPVAALPELRDAVGILARSRARL